MFSNTKVKHLTYISPLCWIRVVLKEGVSNSNESLALRNDNTWKTFVLWEPNSIVALESRIE